MKIKNIFKMSKTKGKNTNINESEKKEKQRKADTISSIVFLGALVLVIVGAIIFQGGGFDKLTKGHGDRKIDMKSGKEVEGIKEYQTANIDENPNISVPGYAKLDMVAGEKTQDVYLNNPENNTCYFKISIVLEDGKQIWKSDMLEPGNAFNRIELDEPLEKGTYNNTLLRYEAYSIVDKRQLNGSDVKLTLDVK